MQLPEDHRVTFPNAAQLPDEQARLIKEVLANTSAARRPAIAKLAERLNGQFNTVAQLPPEQFLATLLKDHIFLTGR
jgi:hypothetical protein